MFNNQTFQDTNAVRGSTFCVSTFNVVEKLQIVEIMNRVLQYW